MTLLKRKLNLLQLLLILRTTKTVIRAATSNIRLGSQVRIEKEEVRDDFDKSGVFKSDRSDKS